MHEVVVAFERSPLFSSDEDLTARAVVLATRQVHEHRLGRLPILRTARPKVGAEVLIELNLEDGRSGCPVSFLAARGHKPPVDRKPKAIRIAETGREHFELVAPCDAAHPLIP